MNSFKGVFKGLQPHSKITTLQKSWRVNNEHFDGAPSVAGSTLNQAQLRQANEKCK